MTAPNMICVVLIGVFAFSGQVFPSLLSKLTENPVEQGLLLAFLNICYPFTSWYAGVISDRYGKPPVLLAGTLLMSIPFFLASGSTGIYATIACVLFFGAGGGVVESQGTALLCDVNPGKERAVVSFSQLFFCLGAMLSPFLIAQTLRRFPDVSMSTIMLVAGALVAASAVLFFPLNKRVTPRHHPSASPERSWVSRDLVIFGFALYLYVATEMGLSGWMVVYGQERYDLPISIAPLLLTCFWSGQGVSRLLLSFAPPRISNRQIVIASTFGMLVFQFAMVSAPSSAYIYPIIALLAFFMGGIWPTLVGMASVRFRANSGTAVGFIVGVGAFAGSATQAMIGLLSERLSIGLHGAMMFLMIPTGINLVLLYNLPRVLSRNIEETGGAKRI